MTATMDTGADRPPGSVDEAPGSSRLWRLSSGLSSVLFRVALVAMAGGLVAVTSSRYAAWSAASPAQRTDDAHVRADITPLGARSAGRVGRVLVADFQRVQAGDLLVELESDDARAQVALAEAAVAAAASALRNVRAQQGVQRSRVAQAAASAEATGAEVRLAALDRERVARMSQAGVSSQQALDHAAADHERAAAALAGRQAEVEAQRRQIRSLEAQESQLAAEVRARQASLDLARIQLGDTRIVAPTDGVIGERKVRPGQLVSAGTQVVSLVADARWVVANFKETQLVNVRPGAPVDLTVDGAPDVALVGRVESIAPATGSQFSLLPPDNASGNFTRVAQRIPVKIALDDAPPPSLRPGMSAVATIRTAP